MLPKSSFAHRNQVVGTLQSAQDENQWHLQEKRLFGSSHVVAGINFAKYDDIEVKLDQIDMNSCFGLNCPTNFLLKHNKLLELEIKNSWFQHRIIADFGRFGSILAAFSDATNDGFSPLCQGQVVHDLLGPRFSIHVNIPNFFVSRTGCWRNLIGDHRRWNWTRAANQDLSGSLWLGHHGVLQLDTSYGKNLIGWMIWWSAAKLDDGSQKKYTRSGILFNESVCQLMVSWWFRWRDLGFTLPQSNNPFYL